MAWKSVEIDASVLNTESRVSTPLKAGDYLLRPIQIVPCTKEWAEKNCGDQPGAKKPFWRAQFKIQAGPERVGGTYSELLTFSEGAMFRLGQLYARCGGDPQKLVGRKFESWEAFDQFAKAMTTSLTKAGKDVGATITERVYNGQTNNQVADFFPAEEYAERTQFTQQSKPAAVAPPAPLDDLLGDPIA